MSDFAKLHLGRDEEAVVNALKGEVDRMTNNFSWRFQDRHEGMDCGVKSG
jgi:hypothetical protein